MTLGKIPQIARPVVGDIEFARGRFVIAGTDRSITVMELARTLREGSVALPADAADARLALQPGRARPGAAARAIARSARPATGAATGPPAVPGGVPGARLVNCGCWTYDSIFLTDTAGDNPYWPGTVAVVDDSGPPTLARLLQDRTRSELSPRSTRPALTPRPV